MTNERKKTHCQPHLLCVWLYISYFKLSSFTTWTFITEHQKKNVVHISRDYLTVRFLVRSHCNHSSLSHHVNEHQKKILCTVTELRFWAKYAKYSMLQLFFQCTILSKTKSLRNSIKKNTFSTSFIVLHLIAHWFYWLFISYFKWSSSTMWM